jgi:hypothetical protein
MSPHLIYRTREPLLGGVESDKKTPRGAGLFLPSSPPPPPPDTLPEARPAASLAALVALSARSFIRKRESCGLSRRPTIHPIALLMKG